MSLKGKYLRGEKWYLMNRDDDGNLLDVIKKDPSKMLDVEYYLEEQKKLKSKELTKSKEKK